MKRLLPTVADNYYQGHKIAKWLLMFYVFKSFFAGCLHMFASDGGAQSIGSVTLDQFTLKGADSVITMFGLWGMEQFIIGLIGFIIIRRYQSLIPLMCGVYVLEYIMRGISGFYTPGLSTAHTPPGAVADYILIPLAIIMFLLSLKKNNNMNFQIFTIVILLSICTLSSCNKDDDTTTLEIVEYATTLNQLDPLDKGGRWLANGIKETNELSSLEEEQEATITNYLNDLALNPATRCDDSANDSFISDLISESYPQEAIDIVENAILRVCSDLNYHEAYWTTEVNNPSIPFPIQVINDMHIDAATKRVTVYAQQRVNGMVIVPAQVGPGECTTTLMGDTACYHPNAVYLNGSGEEFLQADGTGAWWVKHSWVLGGEGYQNWELILEEDYGEGFWVESILLGDDITMKVGDLDGSDGGFYNHRRPLLQNDPVTYSVERYLPPATTPDFSLEWECNTATSAFDGLARSCPKL